MRALLVLSTAAALASACTSSNGGSGGGGTMPFNSATPVSHGGSATLSDFQASVVQLECDYLLKPCCTAANLGYNQATCETALSALFKQYIFTDPNMKYDAAKGKACLDSLSLVINTGKCVEPTTATATTSAPAGKCQPPATTKSDGTAFLKTAECSNIIPDQSTSGSTGTAKPGEACKTSNDCAPNSGGSVYCLQYGANGTTVAVCQIQATSGLGGPCNDGFGTDGAPTTTAHTCSSTSDLKCDYTSKTCVALAKTDEKCLSDSDCTCADICITGKCGVRPKLGDPCTASGFTDPCAVGAWCSAGTCVAVKKDGEACAEDAECAAAFCNSKKCGFSSSGNSGSMLSLCTK